MKIFKKMAAAVSSAVIVTFLCTSVSAEEVVGFDFAPAGDNFVNYDFTADDGATGTLTFTKDEDGNLLFSSYKIDIPVPESPEDIQHSFSNDSDFEDYLNEFAAKNEKTPRPPYYTGIAADFEVKFDPPLSDGMVSMSGSKCYIVDFETMTVSYAGVYCIYEAIVSDDEENVEEDTAAVYCECTAEDGTKFCLYFDKDNGEYCRYEAQIALVDYAVDGAGVVTIGEIDGYKLLEEPPILSLADNERLVMGEVFEDVKNEFGEVYLCIDVEKYFVITLNGADSTVRYIGSNFVGTIPIADAEQPAPDSNRSDGETASPDTGNQNSFFAVMLAAAAVAKFSKK